MPTARDVPRNAEPPTLAAESVDARYGVAGAMQLEQVALDLLPGTLTAVAGPNGSGKSTLVRVLSRTLAPTSGSVLLDQADLYRALTARQSAQSIAVVPQSTDVFLDFTVREIVAMGRAPLRSHRGPLAADSLEDRAAVDAALQQMGIAPDLASRPIAQVSGGERQRALIARALAQEGRVLLLDEPTASLDLRNQSVLLGWLRRLAAEERRAVLVVLHDIDLAAEYADRLIVLSRGRIVADGPPQTILTAALLESVYGVRAWVRSNPLTGRPTVLMLNGRHPASLADGADEGTRALAGRRIHLFCGAGTGARLMFDLTAAGASVTAGILHRGDVDWEAAAALDVPHAEAPPFSLPDAGTIRAADALALGADAAALTDVPLGEINRALFDAARAFAASGRPLVALRGAPLETVDGRAHLVDSADQVLPELVKLLGAATQMRENRD